MSVTTVYKVFGNSVEESCTLQNSWLSAPPLWDYMGMTFLGLRRDQIFPDQGHMKAICALARDEKVPVHFRVVMSLTLDRAYAESEYLLFAASSCIEVGKSLNGFTHWENIGRVMRQINNKQIPELFGVSLGCTSVCDPWTNWPDDDEHRQPFPAVSYAMMRKPSPYA